MTNDQLKVLHIHRNQLAKIDPSTFDRGWFDLVLINVGRASTAGTGKVSSKDLSNLGFERVMAFLEEQLGRSGGKVGTYWRDIERRRGHFLTTRQEWEIKRLYADLVAAGVTYPLETVVSQMSAGRTRDLTQLNPSEAFKVIEMLKAVVERNAATARQEASA